MSTESEETSGLMEFLAWLEIHKQKLLAGGIGAIVVGGAFYVTQWQADQTEQAAGTALYEVQAKEGEADDADKPKAEDYLSIASDNAGTGAAERALLIAARTQFVAGEYDEARATFERFQTEHESSEFVSTALYGVAASQDAAGNLADAKSGYQAVINRFPNAPVGAQAKMAMASIHESSDEAAEALALYDSLNSPSVPTSYSTRALARREQIFEKHPELRPEPEPIETSSVVAPSVLTPAESVTTETVVGAAESAVEEAVSEAEGTDSTASEQ